MIPLKALLLRFFVISKISRKCLFHHSSFLVNSQDRVIRVFNRDSVLAYKEGKEPEATQKLQDLVNRYIAGFSFLTKY